MKPTLVIGASTDPARYAHQAIKLLRKHGHQVFALGMDVGSVGDTVIENQWNPAWKVDTVTLYINPRHQPEFYNKIIELKPERVIFNPGTENREFLNLLEANGIGYEVACTLVLLSLGSY